MHIKIQGGGSGRTANQGSSGDLVRYLEHEDLENLKKGIPIEPFFSHMDSQVSSDEVIKALDNNKRKLSKKDAKFFMITLSPSQKELGHLGNTPEEQSRKLKAFVKGYFMQEYANAFNKGLNASDILYFAKIHHHRKESPGKGNNMHVHVIVSRKTADDKRKISPRTNHRNTRKGPVRGGFSRVDFFEQSEKAFDRRFLYIRRKEEQFTFKKRLKQAGVDETIKLTKEKIRYNRKLEKIYQNKKELLFKQGFSEKQVNGLFKGQSIILTDPSKSVVKGKEKAYASRKYYLTMDEKGVIRLHNQDVLSIKIGESIRHLSGISLKPITQIRGAESEHTGILKKKKKEEELKRERDH